MFKNIFEWNFYNFGPTDLEVPDKVLTTSDWSKKLRIFNCTENLRNYDLWYCFWAHLSISLIFSSHITSKNKPHRKRKLETSYTFTRYSPNIGTDGTKYLHGTVEIMAILYFLKNLTNIKVYVTRYSVS